MKAASIGARNMAQRIANAHSWLIDVLCESASIPRAEGEKAAKFYIANKIAKLDAIGGRYTFQHGWFLDAEVIRRAVEPQA